MKIIDIIKLGLLNIFANLKMTITIIIGFFVVIEIVLLSTGYGISMNKYISNVINNNLSSSYCCNLLGDFSESDIEKFKNEDAIEGVQVIKNYDIYQYCTDQNEIIDANPLVGTDISFDAAVMKLDGVMYRGENDFSYDFAMNDNVKGRTGRIVKYKIDVIEGDENLQISNSEKQEFKNKFNKSTPFVAGKEFTKKNQIVISEYMLDRFNIKFSAEECVGKTISLYVAVKDGEICVADEYEICGVLDSDFFRINSRNKAAQILLSNANPDYCVTRSTSEKIFGKCFREIKGFYDTNSELDILYIDIKTIEYSEVELQQLFFNKVVLIICITIIVTVIVFVYILMYFYFKKRYRYVCIQKAMGMKNLELYSMISIEIGIMEIVAFLISIPIYFMLIKVMNNIISMLVSKSFQITMGDFVGAINFSLFIIIVLNIMISIVEFNKTRKYTVVDREKIL